MTNFLYYFLVMSLLVCAPLSAQAPQQSFEVVAPDKTGLITPVNIKPMDLDEFARRRGLNIENPVRNIVILTGFGMIEDAATIFRAFWKKRMQIGEMENFAFILPRFSEENLSETVKLADFLTGNGRAVGLVSDSDFRCSSACEFISIKSDMLFNRARMALTLSNYKTEEERDKIVRDFSRRNIEYASDRKDLDRLFSAKAEKITGIFRANHFSGMEDHSQPRFDELVTACLSRLTIEKNGFVLLIGAGAAEDAAREGRYVDMLENLQYQEKVLHQINYFVSGRKDTLVLLMQESGRVQMIFNDDFVLSEFLADVQIILNAFKAKDLHEYFFGQKHEKSNLIASVDLVKLKELIAAKDNQAISTYLQEKLADAYKLETRVSEFTQRLPGFALFSRGNLAEVFRGLSTYDEFLHYLALVAGLKTKTNQE